MLEPKDMSLREQICLLAFDLGTDLLGTNTSPFHSYVMQFLGFRQTLELIRYLECRTEASAETPPATSIETMLRRIGRELKEMQAGTTASSYRAGFSLNKLPEKDAPHRQEGQVLFEMSAETFVSVLGFAWGKTLAERAIAELHRNPTESRITELSGYILKRIEDIDRFWTYVFPPAFKQETVALNGSDENHFFSVLEEMRPYARTHFGYGSLEEQKLLVLDLEPNENS